MDIINQVISLMNKEEVRHYKLFTTRTQTDGVRKDIQLFDYIRKTDDLYDEEKIFDKLYENGNKNPFYRLKNRLLSDVNKSLILQHVDDDENIHMFHLLSLARFYRTRNNYNVALHYIRKAEKKAIQVENYELLDFIYSELIQLSHEIVTINPEEYILKRKENREKLNDFREIDDILAAVNYRLTVSQNFSAKENPIYDVLQHTVDDFSDNPRIAENPKLQIALYHAVSKILLSRKEYVTLEEYLLKSYKTFSEKGYFTKSNHEVKLEILSYLVNTLFKNRKLDESLEYCEKLKEAMEEHNRMLYSKYLLFYYNGLIINYSQRDIDKCIEISEQIISDGTFRDKPFFEFIFQTNLSIFLFIKQKYTRSLKVLIKALIHDGYPTAGEGFKLKIAVFEIILRLETSDYDTNKKGIEKARKDYKELLATDDWQQEAKLIELANEMNESIDIQSDKELGEKVREFIESRPKDEPDDYSFIDYYEHLEKKFRLEVEA